MPGLETHVIVNSIFGELFRAKKYMSFFMIGAILPDIFTRIPTLLYEGAYWYVVFFHTPLLQILVCYLIAMCFKIEYRKPIFFWLYCGVVFHFLPDALQRHMGRGYSWFFPFYFDSYQWGLFWPEESLLFVPVLALLWVIVFRNKVYQVLKTFIPPKK
jgi:hypothetical protein